MAGTFEYLYDPNQDVYVITECEDLSNTRIPVISVRPGRVIRVIHMALVTGSRLIYEIQVDREPGVTELEETDVFTDLASAVVSYETRLV